MIVERLKEKVLSGGQISREEALLLTDPEEAPLEELALAADEIRERYCGKEFDLCTIVNGKSGRCSENCKFCAQSGHNKTDVICYPLLSKEEILKDAMKNAASGVLRYSIVTSGRRLLSAEVDLMCEAVREIRKNCDMEVCISFGLLSKEEYSKLKAAGVSRVHNNLETSEAHFKDICSTHTHQDKLDAIRAAREAGLEVCSGGIMGIGEDWNDRIDMALELRSLGIKSIPVNMLNPIKGTPLEDIGILPYDEMRRIVAIYRFILPDASVRLAGGRGLMPDKGLALFKGGSNAAISGDMLTTAGITTATDMKMLKELGYEVKKEAALG